MSDEPKSLEQIAAERTDKFNEEWEAKRTINRESVTDLMSKLGFSSSSARAIVTAIANGEIRHLTINY